jgi:CheY-like chemotaxis protein/nitrogen-specific signal transduction histidine kinase
MGICGISVDITDLRQTEQALRERTIDLQAAREQAELIAAATTQFLATVSHDIRQPFQAVALLLAALEDDVTTTEGKRNLLAIERALGSAMDLLDALLDFIKLDAASLQPHLTAVGIGDVFDVLRDTFSLAAAQKGLAFRVVPSRLAARSDPQLLGRILRNLLSNAIKYTEHGRVLVGCRRRGDHIRIEVWDTGCGIAAEHLQQIFWDFVQVKQPGRTRSGLGLGLAIVDRLAKLLEHRVEVRSWPGRGSVFAVELPAASPTAVSRRIPTSPRRNDIFASKLIAIIDDDESVTKALSALMRLWGATVVTAPHDGHLLRLLAGRRPDLVIADRHLAEGRDGFEALNRLEAELGGTLPALVLTGDYDVHDQDRANLAGRRVLHKPISGNTLHAAVSFELSRSRPI